MFMTLILWSNIHRTTQANPASVPSSGGFEILVRLVKHNGNTCSKNQLVIRVEKTNTKHVFSIDEQIIHQKLLNILIYTTK